MQAQLGHNNPPSEMEILQDRLASYSDIPASLNRFSSVELPETIESDEEASSLTDHVKALKLLSKTVSDVHKKEKSPFWDCCKAADNWKKEYDAKINVLVSNASQPILAWNKKKEEAERKRQLEIAQKAQREAEKLAAEAAAHADVGINDTAEELMNAAIQEEQKASMIANNAVHGVKGKSRSATASATNRKAWTGEVESRAALDLDVLRNYFSEDALDKAVKAAVRDGVREIRGARVYEQEKLLVR